MNAIILAAGSQVRFDTQTPKGLMPINGVPIIELNIRILSDYVEAIFVVASNDNYSRFKYLEERYAQVEVIQIEAGGGTAVSLTRAKKEDILVDDFVLLWSDALNCYHSILDDFYYVEEDTFVVPVVKEKDPYVQFIPNKDNSISKIKFKKLGEKTSKVGLHDLSVFYVPMCHTLDIDNYYKEEFKHDFNFLYLYKYYEQFKEKSVIKEYSGIKDMSFNTLEEYYRISS